MYAVESGKPWKMPSKGAKASFQGSTTDAPGDMPQLLVLHLNAAVFIAIVARGLILFLWRILKLVVAEGIIFVVSAEVVGVVFVVHEENLLGDFPRPGAGLVRSQRGVRQR
jgi:hypothetical protein